MIDRLRWVVDSDRGDLAIDEARREHDVDATERETSSLAHRVLKNLALIRAYEARNDD